MPVAILHLLGTAQPEGRGIARIVATLSRGLDPAKFEVHAWFLGPPGPLVDELRAAGAVSRSLEWHRGAGDPVGAWRFCRELLRHDFAIVHQHFGARSIRRIVQGSTRARLLVHLHGALSPRVAAVGADLVIAASRHIAIRIPGINPVVVHAGVEMCPSKRADRAAARPEVVIGAACRLTPLKGLSDLLRAMALLRPQFPSLRLEIAGDGPQRQALEDEAVQFGLRHCVRFCGWQSDMEALFDSWDIFAMPSRDEGFGMAALEAMAAGLPVIATEIGGLREIVEHGQTGYIVPPSDVVALAERLRRLVSDPAHARLLGAAGRERARQYFAADGMVAAIAALYTSLIA